MANLIGQKLGQYEIISLLGKGGMATVYRARQSNINRDVAFKVIRPDLADAGDFIKRFEREAQTIASLSHLHILKVFEYGQHGDLVYLVMELLTGGSLSDMIRRGALPPDQAGKLLEHIASALDYAHRRGIIHRDLKPQNVLLDEEQNALLTDFGIAKLLGESSSLTQSGMAMGTPAYMAPEQWRGESVDARTDIYALGVILFEMLSGQLPFQGETPFSLMHKHVYETFPPIRSLQANLPESVERVLEKALAKNREERYPSAAELAAAYKGALAGQVFVSSISQDGEFRTMVQPAASPTSGARETPILEHSRESQMFTVMPKGEATAPLGASRAATDSAPQPITSAQPQSRSRLPILLGVGAVIIIGIVGFLLLGRQSVGPTDSTATIANTTGPTQAAIVASVTETSISTTAAAIDSTATIISDTTTSPVAIAVQNTEPATPTFVPPSETPTVAATNTTAPTDTPTVAATNTTAPTETPTETIAPTNTVTEIPTIAPTDTATATETPTTAPTETPTTTPTEPPTETHTPTAVPTTAVPKVGSGRVLFTTSRGTYDQIFMMAADGSNQRAVMESNSDDNNPIMSPDGQRIAFVSTRDGNPQIYLAMADGSNVRPITSSRAAELSPAWSPDSKSIAFQSARDGNPEIYVMSAEDLRPKRLTTNRTQDLSPAWSPDATRIVFQSNRDGNQEIYVMNADGTNQRRMTTSPSGDTQPMWSPDGTQIAFQSNRDGLLGIYTMDVDGGNVKRLTPDTFASISPAWSPDGTQIAFVSSQNGNADIYVIGADGSNSQYNAGQQFRYCAELVGGWSINSVCFCA
jgi:serine/threonine protein kinase/Tol biopolymer transport system component